MQFKINSEFKPTGDQPQAIDKLSKGILRGDKNQLLLGVTGSGKTFTIANVIQNVKLPTLILVHNKTLAAQLYMEFKEFFPNNLVEYFVSYYDYYQPEAYLPTTGTYVEKDLAINNEIEKLRLSATFSLISGRKDLIVISSISCIYGLGNPYEFNKNSIKLEIGQSITRTKFLQLLINILYSRTMNEFKRGTFRITGDIIDVFPAYADYAIRVLFLGNQIEQIITIDPKNSNTLIKYNKINIYPANLFVVSPEILQLAIKDIQNDLLFQYDYFISIGKKLEAKRIKERTEFDLEMMKELGYCSGIENYSRYFDGRSKGSRPFCLLDYFPKNYLMVIDESHVTISQVHAMYSGDLSRKRNLVEYGFRLPSAIDNRPLKFDEFELLQNQTIYVSATPAEYEINKSQGIIVEQIIRPTGLLDPIIEIHSSENQMDNLIEEIHKREEINERVLITTLTKRMAEKLTKFFIKMGIKVRYIHSEIDVLDRVKIIKDFREGLFIVLVGVNLLREGLDLPEVSLVAILDADKEGFLRSNRSLTQTAGRAARNVNGKVIFYADKITKSMKITIMETERRRNIQKQYNIDNNKIPTPLKKRIASFDFFNLIYDYKIFSPLKPKIVKKKTFYMEENQLNKINKLKKLMEEEAKKLNFIQAAKYRDKIQEIKDLIY